MNREWYLLTPEAEALFEWLAKKEPWKKCRYDFGEIQRELGIEDMAALLDHVKQLEEYNRRAVGNYTILSHNGIQGEYWVDIDPKARGFWAEYKKEKYQRMCPECANAVRVELTVEWCPQCKKVFGLPDA